MPFPQVRRRLFHPIPRVIPAAGSRVSVFSPCARKPNWPARGGPTHDRRIAPLNAPAGGLAATCSKSAANLEKTCDPRRI
jgi:hypothetical protein